MKPLLVIDPAKLTVPERHRLRLEGYDVPWTVHDAAVAQVTGGVMDDTIRLRLPGRFQSLAALPEPS